MRKLILFLLLFFAIHVCKAVMPSIVTGNLTYIYISPLKYEVKFVFYTNCNQVADSSNINMMVYSNQNCGTSQNVALVFDTAYPKTA